MGILSRFKDIMNANMNVLLHKAENPEKTIDEYMRSLSSDLGKVKAETASVAADERRAKRMLDECADEIRKMERYAEKSVEAGNDSEALKFLDRKAVQTEKLGELQTAYDQAAEKAAKMKQMHEKLAADIGQLEARHAELKGKMADAKAQQAQNDRNSSAGGVSAAFDAMEEKASLALNEAMALAELRAGKKEDDLDDLIAQLEKDQNYQVTTEDELAAMKARMDKKD
ncbi:PspA/IM30 family protein [Paenibacillus dakarensis]|uniref:PspA/IM30 family protein n=1 Tax=Paenibacillus dakarensis TaxID=1527293 RepID=UPI000ADE18FD|nr:PspA/IM30 family protein [Paenibacillus dakarensis]